MTEKTILIIGAKSDIANATALKFASEGYNLQLAARNISDLELFSKDTKTRYDITISLHELDILDYKSFPEFISELNNMPDIVLCSVGFLGDHIDGQNSFEKSSLIIRTNFEGPALLMGEFANHFEKRKSGTILGISSVAGERGRSSNYIYGSSKAGFTQYLSGLRNRLFNSNVLVTTILPGFVDTKMTKDLKLNKYLTAKPFEVADLIYNAVLKKKEIVYIRPIWKYIMLVIKIIPEFIFKKIKF